MISIAWWWIVVALVVAGAAYVWEKGLLGTATEARIKAMRDRLLQQISALDQWLEAKVAKRLDKQKQVSAAEVELAKDKGTRIAENKALLDKGVISQSEFDAAKEKILAE